MQDKASAASPRARIILGPRQVGKTTLVNHLVRGLHHLVLNGDDERDVRILQDPSAYVRLTGDFEALVIDEAQYVADIGRIVKRLVDVNDGNCRIYVTGSSSLELAGGVRESAAGRFDSMRLWPFSLAELSAASSWIEVKRDLNQRIVYGSCPVVVNEPGQAKSYLSDYAESIFYKDLLRLSEVRRPTDLVKLVRYLAHHVGSEVRYGSVASELGMPYKTVERYVDLLESSLLVKVVTSFSRNPASEVKLSKKIYFFDNGVRNAIVNDFSPLAGRPDAGALWENFFFTERLKLHDFSKDGARIHFWRSKQKHEVDFLEVLDGKVSAFECKLSATRPTTSMRAYARTYPGDALDVATPENIDRFA